jgi:hypothetical protein
MDDPMDRVMKRYFAAALAEAEGSDGSVDQATAVRQRAELWAARRSMEPLIAARALDWATRRAVATGGSTPRAHEDRATVIAWMAARGLSAMRAVGRAHATDPAAPSPGPRRRTAGVPEHPSSRASDHVAADRGLLDDAAPEQA